MSCSHVQRTQRTARALGVGAVLAVGAVLVGALPSPALAQASADSVQRVASDGRVFRSRDAVTLGAFALGAVVAYHNDRGGARAFQRSDVQDNSALRNTVALFRNAGQPGVLLGGISAYAIGRLTHRPSMTAAGLRVTEAIIVTGTLTSLGKFVTGRSRPFVTAGLDPADFRLWRGRKEGYTAMPSGHTSAAFATASALSVEWRAAAPGSARVAVPLLYAAATMVGLSRIFDNKHWASDVVVGAALGTLAGGAGARWGRAHPRNRLERWLLPVRVATEGGGAVRIGVLLEVSPGTASAR